MELFKLIIMSMYVLSPVKEQNNHVEKFSHSEMVASISQPAIQKIKTPEDANKINAKLIAVWDNSLKEK